MHPRCTWDDQNPVASTTLGGGLKCIVAVSLPRICGDISLSYMFPLLCENLVNFLLN